MKIKLIDVAEDIFAGGDVPKDRFSEIVTDEYKIPIYANAEKDNGLYGYTDVARVSVPCVTVAARGTIGFTAKRTEPFLPVVRLITVIPNGEKITLDYLYYALRNCRPKSSGTSIPQLTVPDIKNYSFEIASISRQEKITRILDEIERLIERQRKQMDCYDRLIKSRFVEMFGDTVINSLGWEEHYLDEYIEFLTSGSRGWAKYFVDEENELFITIKNVKDNHISLEDIQYIDAPDNKEAERTKVQPGDLLISITADLGRTGVVDKKIADRGAYINQHLSLVRLKQKGLNPLYVSYFLESEGGKRQFASKNQNGVKAGLNFEAIRSLKVLIPPLEKQNEYLAFVCQVDKLRFATQKSLNETQQLFDSLMQKYFG